MIKSLQIQNYAIIDKLEIVFDHSLNIVTGETGAGKSIILGAFGLLMGKRADTKVLFTKDQKCIIEAVFTGLRNDVSEILSANDLDLEDELIIRREILTSGKTRAFVNDTPVNLTILQQLSVFLADLNQQFELLEIQNTDFHLRMLDAVSSNFEELKTYQQNFKQFKQKSSRLKDLKRTSVAAAKEKDFIEFQLSELTESGLEQGEKQLLEGEQKKLSNTQELGELIQESVYVIESREGNITDQLNALLYRWQKYEDVDQKINDLTSSLHEIIERIQELAFKTSSIEKSIISDPGRLEEITDRLDLLYNLERKHHVNNIEDLISIQESLTEQLAQYTSNDKEILELEKAIADLEDKLKLQSDSLRNQRQSSMTKLEQLINEKLLLLAMPHASVKIMLNELEEFNQYGKDAVEILFSANKGGEFRSIKKVASGGEISRLMLCMKSSVANELEMPSLVFDEIDSGVSGEVALKMGDLLLGLAKSHQLIVITHSPQVSSKARKHFHIYKEDTKDRSITRVKTLSREERVVEIAKMLSGDPPSTSAISNAKELISLN